MLELIEFEERENFGTDLKTSDKEFILTFEDDNWVNEIWVLMEKELENYIPSYKSGVSGVETVVNVNRECIELHITYAESQFDICEDIVDDDLEFFKEDFLGYYKDLVEKNRKV